MPPAPNVHCVHCGYDLSGLPAAPCPECAGSRRVSREHLATARRPLYWIPVITGLPLCLVAMGIIYESDVYLQMGGVIFYPLIAGALNSVCGSIVGAWVAAHCSRLLSQGRASRGMMLEGALKVGAISAGATTLVTYPACILTAMFFQNGSAC